MTTDLVVRRMTLKLKLLSLFFLTLLLALGAIGFQFVRASTRLGEHQRELIESSMLSQKQAELERAVAFLKSELGASFPAGSAPDPERVKAIIAAASAGPDGYFFLYDLNGICLVHPRQPQLVGQNLQSLRDDRGRLIIPSLIETARAGGGFRRYSWLKPSTGRVTEKLGYVSLLEPWGWMIGTGVYLDDVEAATRSAHASSEASIQSTSWRFAAVALVALMAVFLGGLAITVTEQRIADRKLRHMADRVLHLQEEERARVARDLHDGIVQVIVSARFLIEAGRARLHSDAVSCDELLGKSLLRLDEAVTDVRNIAHDLLPATVGLGLGAALRELADQGPRLGLQITLKDEVGSLAIGKAQTMALLRTAQEALVNVERHAQATHIQMALTLSKRNRVCLRVVDNGKGFDPRAVRAGSGLGNMRHRIEELDGTFRVLSRPGQTEIFAELEVEP